MEDEYEKKIKNERRLQFDEDKKREKGKKVKNNFKWINRKKRYWRIIW